MTPVLDASIVGVRGAEAITPDVSVSGRRNAGILYILRPSFLGTTRGMRAAKLAQAFVAGLVVWSAIFWLCRRGLTAFSQYPEIADAMRGRMLTMSIEAIAVLTVMAATQAALDQCFLSNEVGMLVRAPVDWLVRCSAQMIRIGSWALAPVGLVLTPLLAAVAWTSSHRGLVLAMSFLGLPPLLASAAAIGILLALGLASISGAERGKSVLVVGGALLVGVVMFLARGSSVSRLLVAMHGADPMAMADLLNTNPAPVAPVAWWANAIAHASSGVFDWPAMVGFWGSALGLVVVSMVLYGWLYDRVRGLGGRGQQRSASSAALALHGALGAVAGPEMASIITNDLLRVWRNRADWSHTLLLGFAGAVYLMNIATLPLGGNDPTTHLFAQVLTILNIGVAALILASLAAHYVLPSVAFEWPGKTLLAGAPVRAWSIVLGKFYVSMLVCLPFGIATAWLTAHIVGVGGGVMWVTLAATTITGIGVIALALWLGCREPRLVPDGAAQTIASIETTLFVAMAFGLSLLVIGLISPYTIKAMGTTASVPDQLKELLTWVGRWGGLAFILGLLTPLAVAAIALFQARKSLTEAGLGQSPA